MWLDVRNQRDFVPDYNGDIIMKVMRLSWTDEEGDIDIQVYLSVQIYPALLLIVFSLPAQPRTSQGSMQAPTTSCRATTALTTRSLNNEDIVRPLQSPRGSRRISLISTFDRIRLAAALLDSTAPKD